LRCRNNTAAESGVSGQHGLVLSYPLKAYSIIALCATV
jgi:hypothetical protein